MMLTLTPATLHGSRSPFEKIMLEAEEIPRYSNTQDTNKNYVMIIIASLLSILAQSNNFSTYDFPRIVSLSNQVWM